MREADHYLETVEGLLPFTDDRFRAEVMQELRDHLDDSIAGAMREGLAGPEAERRAVARLGAADQLARSITRVHQTPERVLQAVTGALWGTVRIGIPATILGAFLVVGVMLPLALLTAEVVPGVMRRWLDIGGANPTMIALMLVLPSYMLGVRLTWIVADRSRRSMSWARRVTAVVGAAIIGLLALFEFRGEQSETSVAVLLSLPLAFALGTVRTAHRPRHAWLIPAAIVAGLGVSVVLYSALFGGVTGSTGQGRVIDDGARLERIGRLAPTYRAGHLNLGSPDSGSVSIEPGEVVTVLGPSAAGYADVRFEVWRAARATGYPSRKVDPEADGPIAVVAASTDSAGATAVLDLRSHHTIGNIVITLTGVRDGERYILARPLETAWGFGGSAWDWLRTS